MIHTVKPGETLIQISRDYRTPVASIIAANPGIQSGTLYVGQPIIIPGFPDPKRSPTVLRFLQKIVGYVSIEIVSYKNNIQ